MTSSQLSRSQPSHAPLSPFESLWTRLKEVDPAGVHQDEALCIMSLTAQYHWSPPVVLEIGTGHGVSAILMNMGGAHVVTFESDESKLRSAQKNARDFAAKNLIFIPGKSPEAVQGVSPDVRKKINMAFIDGDHSYESVLEDLREAVMLVPLAGWVMGLGYGREPGVTQAVDEIASTGQMSNPILFTPRQADNSLFLSSLRV